MNQPVQTLGQRLVACEQRIRTGAHAIGAALREIREDKLYVSAGFASFADYCEARHGMSREQARRIIGWCEVAEHLAATVPPIGGTTPVPEIESHARPLTSLTPEQQTEAWQEAVSTAPETGLTAKHVEETRDRLFGRPDAPATSRSVLHSSESHEWYTPKDVVELARELLGNIDLDPASCVEANQTVQAGTIFTAADDGLAHEWFGRVWLNPPYGKDASNKSHQAIWTKRLLLEHGCDRVSEACLLVNAATGARWFQALWRYPICFVTGRLQFDAPEARELEENHPTHYSAIAYLGPQRDEFRRLFSQIGHVAPPQD